MKYAQSVGRGLACAVVFTVIAVAVVGCRRQPEQRSRGRAVGTPAARTAPGEFCPPDRAAGAGSRQPAAPSWRPVAGNTVILDPGHGGRDEGASHFGLLEKEINLDLAHRTAQRLRARGVNVIMTRSDDAFIPLAERSAVANRHPNAIFVSIHVNAVDGKPQVAGIETFVLSKEFSDAERGQTAADRYGAGGDSVDARQALANLAERSRARGPALASSLQRSLCGRLGDPDRGVKHGNLAVLRETYFGPAALVEVGFLTNPATAQRMRGEDWRRRASEAICEGVCEFLRQPE